MSDIYDLQDRIETLDSALTSETIMVKQMAEVLRSIASMKCPEKGKCGAVDQAECGAAQAREMLTRLGLEWAP